MMLETKTSPNSTLNLIGIALILAGLGSIYFYEGDQLKVAQTSYLEAKTTETEKKNEVTVLEKAQAELSTKESQIQSQGVTIDTLNAIMPATEDMPALFIQMEAIIKNATTISKATYQLGKPTADTTGGVKIPVTITGTGKYADVKDFLRTLETSSRPLSFTTVGLTQATDAAQAGQYSLTATGFIRARAISPAYGTGEAKAVDDTSLIPSL